MHEIQLPVDCATARLAGTLSDRARALGHAPGLAGLIIAATAARHGSTILTHNLRHFSQLDIPARDPLATLPAP